jgi:type I restriction enzyme S subunit
VSDVYEMSRNLPLDWSTADLGDLLERITNGMNANQSKVPVGTPISRIETISQGVVNFERVQYVTDVDEKKFEHFSLKKGDILFSHINSDLHLGKTAVFQSDKTLLHGINLLLLRTKRNLLNPKYLHYTLNCYRANGLFMAIAQHAVNQSSLNQTKIKSLKIPLPPRIEDQQQIVAEIEKQFSRLDEAVASLKRIQANLKRYKAAVLKAAVEGKLTEQWRKEHPDVEPADQLLKRILAERRAKWEAEELAKMKAKETKPKDDSWKKKYKEPAAPDTANLPELPEEWVWASVEQIADIMLGKMLDKAKHLSGNKLPYLRNVNVRWGRIVTEDLFEMFFEDSQLERYGLISGDVLVCEGGEPGRAAVWNGRFSDMKYQKALHRVRCCKGYEPRMLLVLLEYLAKSGRLEKWFTGSTIKHFTRESFVQLPVPLQSISEQKIILDEIDRRLSVTEELEATIETNLKRAERLRQTILKQAFSGELLT